MDYDYCTDCGHCPGNEEFVECNHCGLHLHAGILGSMGEAYCDTTCRIASTRPFSNIDTNTGDPNV